MAFLASSDGAASLDSDLLQYTRYVDPLADLICDEDTVTPLTVGVFGAWGSGKSSLLGMLDERLGQRDDEAFVRVHFNPWVHRNEDDLLVPLLHTLHDALNEDRGERFKQSASRIWNVGARLGIDILLKRLTADAASLENIDQLSEKYMLERGRVESETRRLRSILQEEANRIHEKGARLVFFIDDLDRCEPSDIIDVLEMVKLFLDVEHSFVVLAVDKEVIDRGVQIKYAEFNFAAGREADIGAEYMEKMVQLPVHLHPLHVTRIRSFLEALQPPDDVASQLDLLEQIVLPNPRKMKRILNLLAFTDRMLRGDSGLEGLDRGVMARLIVLQVQAMELFAEVAAQPDLLLALDRAYAGKRHDVLDDYGAYGPRRQAIFDLTQRWYRPDTFLAEVFRGSPFTPVEEELSFYMGILPPPRSVA